MSKHIIIKSAKLFVAGLVLAVCALLGYRYWQHSQLFPSTDDAYVQSHIVNISANLSGRIASVRVKNHQAVHKGQLLFTLDPAEYQLAVNKAQAALANLKQTIKGQQQTIATAQSAVQEHNKLLATQQRQTQRMLNLAKQKLVSAKDADLSVTQLNNARAALASAKNALAAATAQAGDSQAQIKSAQDDIHKAQLQLSYTQITAPANGTIDNMDLRPGDSINAFQGVFALVENHPFWIIANFKETQLARLSIGQPVNVTIDMYPHEIFHGTISSISSGSGTSFSLIPPENATGNWVKVTQRFPVKILLDTIRALRIGASATVMVNTTHSTHHHLSKY